MIVDKEGNQTSAEIIELRPQKLVDQRRSTQEALSELAEFLANVEESAIPEARRLVSFVEKWGEETRRRVDQRVLMYLSVHGEKVTENGTKEAVLGGHRIRAIPTRGGLDVERLKALLVSKGVKEPEKYFEKVVTYKPTKTTLDVLVSTGVLTEEEAQSVCKDTSYRVEVK
jgi:hypothetical protein